MAEVRLNYNFLAGLLLVVIAGIWLVSGGPYYIVGPDEEGVVKTFGKYTKSSGPGFHLKFPWPIQSVETPKVTEVKRIEVGLRTMASGMVLDFRNSREMLQEAQMLTGDENIVNADMIIQYKIKDAPAYLFNLRNPEGTLRHIGEAVERLVMGDHSIDDALINRRIEIQTEMKDLVQELADKYRMGIQVVQVQLQDVYPPQQVERAFKDVATAREDKERMINEARGYANDKIPQAEGAAARILRESESYAKERITRAEGDVSRFLALAKEYTKSPEVTEERLYQETMQSVLRRADKIIVDEEVGLIGHTDLGNVLKEAK